jgi:hypothetical protein
MVVIQASKHTEENYGGPHSAPLEVIVVTRAISAKSSENQVFCHQFGIPLWRCVWDSNDPFAPNPTEAGGESVLSFLSLGALAPACAPGVQQLFLQRNTSETARGPGDRNTVQARYG